MNGPFKNKTAATKAEGLGEISRNDVVFCKKGVWGESSTAWKCKRRRVGQHNRKAEHQTVGRSLRLLRLVFQMPTVVPSHVGRRETGWNSLGIDSGFIQS